MKSFECTNLSGFFLDQWDNFIYQVKTVQHRFQSKSLNRHKEGVKFYDLFLLSEWHSRDFLCVSIILPLDFQTFEYF